MGREPEPRRLTRKQFVVTSGGAFLGVVALGACGGSSGGDAATADQGASSAASESTSATSSPETAASGAKIGLELPTFNIPRYPNVDLPAFEKAVSARGFTPVNNQANGDPQLEASNIESLLAQGVVVLVLQPIVGEEVVALVQRSVDDGVPVLAYNSSIPSDQISGFVARDNIAVGQQVAEAAREGQGLTGNWVVVSGDVGNSVAEEWTEGILNVLEPLAADNQLTIVAQQWIKNWDPQLARNFAEDMLTKTDNKVDGFFCTNDDMAIGVLSALESQGLAGKVWLTGQDATAAGCRAIVEGKMTLSSFTRFDVMGGTAGNLAADLANGQTLSSDLTYDTGAGVVPLFPIESFNVTRDNMVEYLQSYSPAYVDAAEVFEDVPESEWPEGTAELLAG